ncbi:acyclic terpene utilization AtuA family protein [Hoeflea sp. YIM 152468]|uniref:acyclic terpene utilization AtuA family protein n=1 Tax=Hoeflea sp. YIM 152468 TaxID=3031759 RepID=UPI0023DA688A|nr:acyclic terpene utilization AtuA family protein [Hoeflea sp. YIM 152468]MDF1608669.1 acyclic terpene utilization AtuA family protein [Hoeflea sp. YIM 152468]
MEKSKSITVLTPTGTLGYGFGAEALSRGMSLGPAVIAVDAGSTDPGPSYLGSNKPLVSDYSIRRELKDLISAAHQAGIPVIVGSAGGAGTGPQVDRTVALVRSIVAELGIHLKLAWIYADIPIERAKAAVDAGEVQDFEVGAPLTTEILDQTCSLVAQMGHEPICAALEAGADVIIAGRACDDSVIAAFPIWKGAEPALAIHMGKILECGAFSAEPFAMDVMLGTVHADHFILEPGSSQRRASVKSVAAHSLYERENPFSQGGPGHIMDLSSCSYQQSGQRQVKVAGARISETDEYYVKLEGARLAGYRSVCIAGIRCPTLIKAIDGLLEEVRAKAIAYFAPEEVIITFHLYGRNGVMKDLETAAETGHELGLVIDVVADSQELAHAACHQISGGLLHYHYPDVINPSGNLAFPYSPSDLDLGPHYEFSAYHLMKVTSPTEVFPVHFEDL